MSELLLRDLERTFAQLNLPSMLIVNPITLASVFQKYMDQGQFRKIRFQRHKLRRDTADAYVEGASIQDAGYIEIQVVAKRNSFLDIGNSIGDVVSQKKPAKGLVELLGSDIKFDPDTIKVEVDYKGRTRTVELTDLSSLRAFHDISDQVDFTPEGHPSFESVDKAARELLKDLLEEKGMSTKDV